MKSLKAFDSRSSLEVGLLNVLPQILRAVFLVPQLVPKTAEVIRTFRRVYKNNACVGLVLSHVARVTEAPPSGLTEPVRPAVVPGALDTYVSYPTDAKDDRILRLLKMIVLSLT